MTERGGFRICLNKENCYIRQNKSLAARVSRDTG